MITGWVDGVQKSQNLDYVIYGWSLMQKSKGRNLNKKDIVEPLSHEMLARLKSFCLTFRSTSQKVIG